MHTLTLQDPLFKIRQTATVSLVAECHCAPCLPWGCQASMLAFWHWINWATPVPFQTKGVAVYSFLRRYSGVLGISIIVHTWLRHEIINILLSHSVTGRRYHLLLRYVRIIIFLHTYDWVHNSVKVPGLSCATNVAIQFQHFFSFS